MDRFRFALGLALTAAAGAIDAVSFTRFGAVYASFMSGNTVQLGLHGAERDWGLLGTFALLVALFMLGALLGGLVMAAAGRAAPALILVANSLLLWAAVWIDVTLHVGLASTAPLALAMGAQNQLVVLVQGANPGTTFVTGTAFRFGDALAQALLRRDPNRAWRFHFAVWLAFGAGATAGAVASLELGERALAPIALLMSALAATALLRALPSSRPA
ncbi:MAG: DUF1275 domain-containing protein [Methylobacteriaceae bacterium]|nr:DUF1275 domain-containing protein [Methylobacteriaceae bacterium]